MFKCSDYFATLKEVHFLDFNLQSKRILNEIHSFLSLCYNKVHNVKC